MLMARNAVFLFSLLCNLFAEFPLNLLTVLCATADAGFYIYTHFSCVLDVIVLVVVVSTTTGFLHVIWHLLRPV